MVHQNNNIISWEVCLSSSKGPGLMAQSSEFIMSEAEESKHYVQAISTLHAPRTPVRRAYVFSVEEPLTYS